MKNGEGVQYIGSSIAPLGSIVTISTLLSLYRWGINGEHVVHVHDQCNVIIGIKQICKQYDVDETFSWLIVE